MNVLTAMSPKGKALLAGCALAFVVVAFLLVRMASAPAYTELATGLEPKKTGEITAALDEAAVPYEVRGNGSTVAVEKASVAQARIALAEKGLGAESSSDKPGYELLDKQKLGTSQQQQQVAYQRALEGEISNTISQIDGVGSATVALTLPKDDLFADESQAATAAVMLDAAAGELDAAAVRGVANLVASSVQGLKADKVTITDSSGAMLWPQGDGTAGAASKVAAQARYDQQLEARLSAMLAATLGAGKAQVQVHSDLNVDQATEEKLEYAEEGTPLKTTEETETLRGTGGAAAGAAAGTATNVPNYGTAGGAGGGGTSNYRKSSRATEVGVDKTVTRRTIAPGQVNKLGVSVLVDQSARPDLATLQANIAAAAGIDPQRGDTLEVRSMAFAKQPAPVEPAAGPVPAGALALAKPIGLGLAALLFLFFLTRGLKKRQAGAFADEPSWLRQLEAPRIAAAIGGGGDGPGSQIDAFDPQAAAREVFKNDPRALALEELVQREPEKVAHQLRTWITDDKE